MMIVRPLGYAILLACLIALVVWLAGVVIAARFGQVVDTAASIALVAFGATAAAAAIGGVLLATASRASPRAAAAPQGCFPWAAGVICRGSF